ncbi:MAG: fasciclin domain-containing protein [Oceanipulchritudo sp.]
MKKILSLLIAGLFSVTPLMAEEGEALSIAEIAAYTPDSFSTLTAALVTTDLAQTLNNKGPFTVFAPTNAAFDAAAQALLGDESATGLDLLLSLDKETLETILLYHVVPGKLLSGDVLADDSFETASGDMVTRDGTTIVGGQGSSGNLILDLIDIEAANGVVHVIDGVLLPPVEEDPGTIVDIALGNPAFSTLVAAVQKAGLVNLLSTDKYELTVFAPVNSAFDAAAKEALGENATGMDLVEALSPWKLRYIIYNHVLFGERFSDSILDSKRYFTFAWSLLYREDLTLYSRNGQGTLVPDLIDIDASNGVIHVVDGVLLP